MLAVVPLDLGASGIPSAVAATSYDRARADVPIDE
jgi:hypothetical protein